MHIIISMVVEDDCILFLVSIVRSVGVASICHCHNLRLCNYVISPKTNKTRYFSHDQVSLFYIISRKIFKLHYYFVDMNLYLNIYRKYKSFRFAIKAGITASAAYFIAEQGVWKDTETTYETSKRLNNAIAPYWKQVEEQLPFEVKFKDMLRDLGWITCCWVCRFLDCLKGAGYRI